MPARVLRAAVAGRLRAAKRSAHQGPEASSRDATRAVHDRAYADAVATLPGDD